MVLIEVTGLPAPKGSPNVVTHRRAKGGERVPLPFPKVLPDSERTVSWANAVTNAAVEAMRRGHEMFVGQALRVVMEFRFKRPAGHYGKNGLKPSAPEYPAVRPDSSKLARTTEDALEGVVFDNDARIVEEVLRKVYCRPGQTPGAVITVEVMRHALELFVGEAARR